MPADTYHSSLYHRMIFFFLLYGCITPLQSPAVPGVSARKTDALINDVNANGMVNPGDAVRYTVTITNTGTVALDVLFSDAIDTNAMLVADSVKTTPIARDDVYTALGNVMISNTAANGVLANDSDPDGSGSLSVISYDSTSTNGGTVLMNTDGSFTYNPPAGLRGADWFRYVIEDADGNTDNATVQVAIQDMIWFIDSSAGVAGDGGMFSPYNSLAAFDAGAADTNNDIIFLYQSGGSSYAGGITLLNGQQLIGQGVDLASAALLTVPAESVPLPGITSNPIITAPAGNGVTLAQDNRVLGVTIGNTTGTGISGAGFSSLVVSNVTISGSGMALYLAAGTGSLVFTSITADSSSAEGILATNITGSIHVSGTTTLSSLSTGGIVLKNCNDLQVSFNSVLITTVAGDGIALNALAGTGGMVHFGQTTIQNTSSRGIQIDTVSVPVTFGNTTVNNAGAEGIRINASNNNLTFGTCNINNRNATGILISNAGSAANSLQFGTTTIANPNSVGGYGIRADNVNAAVIIIAANISDTKQTTAQTDGNSDGIPDNDGDGDAIFLKNTSGSFTVNGGTIQNIADDALDCRTVSDVTLDTVTIQDIGISSGNAPSVHPDAFFASNLSGINRISGCTIRRFETAANSRGINIINTGTDFGEIRIKNSILANTGAALNGSDGLRFIGRGAVNGAIIIEDDHVLSDGNNRSAFTGLAGYGAHISIGESAGSGEIQVDIQNTTFEDAVNPSGFGGVLFISGGSAIFDNLVIQGCKFDDLFNSSTLAGLIDIQVHNTSKANVLVDSSILEGNATAANDGAQGIRITTGDQAGEFVDDLDVTIRNNTFNDTEREAIYIDVLGDALTVSGNPAKIRITNNAIGGDGFGGGTPVAQNGHEAVEIQCRDSFSASGAKTMDLFMAQNYVRNADNSSGDETLDIDSEDSATINATVLSNAFSSVNGIASDECEITTQDATATINLDLQYNTCSEGVSTGNGSFQLDRAASSTFAVFGPINGSGTGPITELIMQNDHHNSGSVEFSVPEPVFNNNTPIPTP